MGAEGNSPQDPLRPRTVVIKEKISRDPDHAEHGTRNVRLPNGRIRKFHYRLLFAINGEKII